MPLNPLAGLRIDFEIFFYSKNQYCGSDKKSGSGSGMNNPNLISESLETIFWVKILKFFDADPGWKKYWYGSGMEKIRIRDPE
jgi:hypothetical protein